MTDRHLNLFYTYNTNHLEDNVTRALAITLQQLTPAHLRLLLKDCFLSSTDENDPSALAERIELMASDEFEFDLQVTRQAPGEAEEDALLTRENGFLLGITRRGDSDPITPDDAPSDETTSSDSGGRPDAWIADNGNQVAGIVEVKLGDDLYKDQLHGHFETFFDQRETRIQDVFHETSWDQVVSYLEAIRGQTQDPVENHYIRNFVDYVDMLGLVSFRGFRRDDFGETRGNKIPRRFLQRLDSQADETDQENPLGMEVDPDSGQIHFEENDDENLYVWKKRDGLSFDINVGMGDKWRSKRFKRVLSRSPETLRGVFDDVHAQARGLDPACKMSLVVHSRFFYSRFRNVHLWDIGDSPFSYDEPGAFERFADLFGSDTKNSYKPLTKEDIQRRFADDLEGRDVERDEDGRFPKWTDGDDNILQNCSFVVRLVCSPDSISAMDVEEVLDYAREILEIEKEAVFQLDEVAQAGK